jgi:hypothetical protein
MTACDWQLFALTVTCDFEQALVKACTEAFTRHGVPPVLVLCLFHWKQCLKTKSKKLGLPKNNISLLIGEEGFINLLTVIPVDDILIKGK